MKSPQIVGEVAKDEAAVVLTSDRATTASRVSQTFSENEIETDSLGKGVTASQWSEDKRM